MMVFSFSAPKIESRSPVALEHMVRSLNGYALPPKKSVVTFAYAGSARATAASSLGWLRSRLICDEFSPMSKKLFHYTPVFRAVMILRDDVIRRSSGNAPPYVWLSRCMGFPPATLPPAPGQRPIRPYLTHEDKRTARA